MTWDGDNDRQDSTRVPFIQFQVMNNRDWQLIYGLDARGQIWLSSIPFSEVDENSGWRHDVEWWPVVGPPTDETK